MYPKLLISIMVLGLLVGGVTQANSNETRKNSIDDRFVHIENPDYLRFNITINNILKNYIKLTKYENIYNDRTFFLLGFDGAIVDNAYSQKAMDLLELEGSEAKRFANIPSNQCNVNFMTRSNGEKEIHAIFNTSTTVKVGIEKCITLVVGFSFGLNIKLNSEMTVLDILELQFRSIREQSE